MTAVVETGAEPVTVVVSRRIDPHNVAAYIAWTDEAIARVAEFPGFLGAGVLHPGPVGDDHHLVFRFATPEQLHAWETAPERADLIARLDPLVVSDRTHKVTGLEAWFARPGTHGVPARWKQALLTLVAVYPLQLLLAVTLAPHLHQVFLRTAISAVLLVALMTWVIMPQLSRLVRGWLYPKG